MHTHGSPTLALGYKTYAGLSAQPSVGEPCVCALFFNKVMEICKGHRIIFVADEIQTGLGRTGKFASGIGISAVVGKEEIMDMPAGSHTFTSAANPIIIAASYAALQILKEEKLVENSGAYNNWGSG